MLKASLFFTASLFATILFMIGAPLTSAATGSTASPFSFVSMGDSHGNGAGQDQTLNFINTVNQAASLHPDFVIHNGDLEDNGVNSSQMSPMVAALKNAGLYNQTFFVRGNHDDHLSSSLQLWQSYFSTAPNLRTLPAGVKNYVGLASSSTYLTYSFDYGNSRFIGVDVPGDADMMTSAEYAFIDQRLTNAEALGLVHAFIFFHGPEYCVESTHCACSAKKDGSCTQASFINLLNRHPIVSATFHGHEHLLGWVHMDNTRVPGLTHPYEEFFTSPSGGYYYTFNPATLYSARVDYAYTNMGSSQGFAAITVNCTSFTVNMYKDGTTAPVWSKTFIKGACPTPTATMTFTPSDTPTATNSPSPTNTDTPASSATPTWTETQTETPTSTTTPTWTETQTDTPTSTLSPTAPPTFTPSATLTPPFPPALNTIYMPLIRISPSP
jgi:hypothetical protein